MIHLNYGDDKHVWISKQKFEERYPEIAAELSKPPENDKLKKVRIKKRVTIRDMMNKCSLSADQLSKIEVGLITDQNLADQYIMALNQF